MKNIKNFSDETRLSAEQRELLAYLLEEEGIEISQNQEIDLARMPSISRRDNPGESPLSFAQERLWFLDQFIPHNPAYNIPIAFRIEGQLNNGVLEQCLNEIVQRHETLRTKFIAEEGRPIQATFPKFNLSIHYVNFENFVEKQLQSITIRLAVEEAQKPFDLTRDALVRAKLLCLSAEEHVLLLTMHHAVSDGWSLGVLLRELAVLYEAFSKGKPSPLPVLPIQYGDFAVWQRQRLQGEVLETQLDYWKQNLSGSLPVLDLPTDRPRPSRQTFRGAKRSLNFPKPLLEALKTLSQQQGVTLFMTLLTAFKVLLYRYTGQEDILVGAPVAGRNQIETENLIGFFVNVLVLRTDLSGNPTFRDCLERVRKVVLGAYNHQEVPFEKLVETLQPERDLSYSPLFQVMFALQNTPMPSLEFSGLTLSPLAVDNGTAKFDLTLDLSETSDGIDGFIEYNTDLFDGDTIARMVGHFQTLLEAIAANPQQRVSELPLLTAAERHQLLVEWNDTQAEYPKDVCIHQLFEAQVEQTPEAVAVVFEDQQLTYRELNTRANQLAHHLQTLGVGPEIMVGICIERSLEMVVGLLGILKAGGAYVPLDPAYPQERLAFMLSDSQTPVLLTQKKLMTGLTDQKARVVCLDTDWEVISQEHEGNLVSDVKPRNLAYTLYTSGSTGRPKGVVIEHHSPVALLHWAREVFTAEQLAGVLASTSICFDLSVFELFVPLSWGGKAILAENALYLPTLSAAQDVTLINTVPSAIAELLRIDGVPTSVQTVNLAGEPLQNSLVQKLYQQDTIQQVFNLYGPSEDTTYSTFVLLKKGDRQSPTIGRPIANTQIYILDAHLQPVPIGVRGELHISGAGLARGYLNHSELNEEKFIFNSFRNKPGTRLYKTGDLARYLPDGNIEFLGRIDHQVKIRGFRIELGEIEAVLAQHPEVREAVVIAREDQINNKHLVAYVVPPNQEEGTTPSELCRFLKKKLPDYMVPSAFVSLEAMPLTPNGKIDRRALPVPDQGSRSELEGIFVAPRTPVEEEMARIWAEVLGIKQIGVHDNFFELGGHSLLATQLISRLREAFQVELPLRDLFEAPTVADQTLAIEKSQVKQKDRTMTKIQVVSRGNKDLDQLLAKLDQLSDTEVKEKLHGEKN